MILTYEHGGKHFDISLPTEVSSIPYSKFLDWRSPILAFVQNEVKNQEKERAEVVPEKVNADNFHELAAIHQQEFEKSQQSKDMTETEYLLNSFKMFLTMIEMGAHIERPEILETLTKSLAAIIPERLNSIPITNDGEDLKALLENGIDWMDGNDISLVRLTCYLCNLFKNYIALVPPIGVAYSCEYKDETYFIEPERVKRLNIGKEKGKGWTTDEVNEFTEYQRIFDKKIETKGDPDGSLEFEMCLLQLAILLRKEGEEMPETRDERRKWVYERSRHFADMPMSTVYEVRTFFLRTLGNLLMSRIMQRISGKPLPSLTSKKEATNTTGKQKRTRRKFQGLSMKRSGAGQN